MINIKRRDITKSVDPDGTQSCYIVSNSLTDPVQRWLFKADFLDGKINAEGNKPGSMVNPFGDDYLVYCGKDTQTPNTSDEYDYFPATRSNIPSRGLVPIGSKAARSYDGRILISSPNGKYIV